MQIDSEVIKALRTHQGKSHLKKAALNLLVPHIEKSHMKHLEK